MSFLGKLFGSGGGDGDESAEMTPDAAEKTIQDYGAVLATSAPTLGWVADADNLPHSKERIKQAIALVLPQTEETQSREALIIGYLQLADWQEGVGSEQIGMDLMNADPDADPIERMKHINSQWDVMEKWKALMEAEREALKAELENLK